MDVSIIRVQRNQALTKTRYKIKKRIYFKTHQRKYFFILSIQNIVEHIV